MYFYHHSSEKLYYFESLTKKITPIDCSELKSLEGICVIHYTKIIIKDTQKVDFNWDKWSHFFLRHPILLNNDTFLNQIWDHLAKFHFKNNRVRISNSISSSQKNGILRELCRRYIILINENLWDPRKIDLEIDDDTDQLIPVSSQLSSGRSFTHGPALKKVKRSRQIYQKKCMICLNDNPTDLTCSQCNVSYHKKCCPNNSRRSTIGVCFFCWCLDRLKDELNDPIKFCLTRF